MAERPVDDSGPTSRAIEVDLTGLADLANTVRRENAETLVPQSGLVRSELRNGVCFGSGSASGSVYEAKARYDDSLRRAMQQMDAHVRAAEIIADAAELVARNYIDADAMSKARVAEVEQALTQAVTKAEVARQSHAQGPSTH